MNSKHPALALLKASPEALLEELVDAIEQAEEDLGKLAADSDEVTFKVVNGIEALFKPVYLINDYFILRDIQDAEHFAAAKAEADKAIMQLEEKIFTDPALASNVARMENLYNKFERHRQKLRPESTWLLHAVFQKFKDYGAYLEDNKKCDRLYEIMQELAGLGRTFNINLSKGAIQQAYLCTDKAELADVPDTLMNAYARKADLVRQALRDDPQGEWSGLAEKLRKADAAGKPCWIIVPTRFDVEQLMTVATNRAFCSSLMNRYQRVGAEEPYNNNEIIERMHALRQKKARIFGKGDYTAYAMEDSLLKDYAEKRGGRYDPSDYMKSAMKKLLPELNDYADKIQRFAREKWPSISGQPASNIYEESDFPFFALKYFEHERHFDAKQFSRRLTVEKLLGHLSDCLQKDFGVTLKAHETNRQSGEYIFDIYKNVNGVKTLLPTRLCFDLFKREGKRGLAWMANIPGRTYVITNLDKAPPGEETPLTWD